jgi:hypothetical protein
MIAWARVNFAPGSQGVSITRVRDASSRPFTKAISAPATRGPSVRFHIEGPFNEREERTLDGDRVVQRLAQFLVVVRSRTGANGGQQGGVRPGLMFANNSPSRGSIALSYRR